MKRRCICEAAYCGQLGTLTQPSLAVSRLHVSKLVRLVVCEILERMAALRFCTTYGNFRTRVPYINCMKWTIDPFAESAARKFPLPVYASALFPKI